MQRGWLAKPVLAVLMVTGANGDEFDRIEGPALFDVPKSKDATTHQGLTVAEIEGLPNVLRETRSALMIASTDQGNLARLLLVPALRKPPGGQGEPVPVLVLERFDTFDAGNPASRLARGREVILFDGFQFDLDTGQVVPEGQGGDLRFRAAPKSTPRLEALGPSKLYTLSKSPAPEPGGSPRPTLGRAVLPADFAGRYRLFANGQWSGTLDLKVGADRTVSGSYRSDLNGTSYPVSGRVAADVPQKVTFTVNYPRARQDFEGLLWTEGKGAMAGTLTMRDRAYGFFAVREGGRFAPEGEDVAAVEKGREKPHRRTVTVRKGQYTLDGRPKTDQELTDDLKKAVAAEPETWVLLRVPEDESYAAVNRALEAIGAAGVGSVRLSGDD
jgi:hypothetical protein